MLVLELTRNNSCFSTGVGNVLCHDTLLSHQQIWTGIQAVDNNPCLHYKLSSLCRTDTEQQLHIPKRVYLYDIFLFYQKR